MDMFLTHKSYVGIACLLSVYQHFEFTGSEKLMQVHFVVLVAVLLSTIDGTAVDIHKMTDYGAQVCESRLHSVNLFHEVTLDTFRQAIDAVNLKDICSKKEIFRFFALHFLNDEQASLCSQNLSPCQEIVYDILTQLNNDELESDVNKQYGAFQVTPLMQAAAIGSADIASWLLTHGAKLDMQDAYGQTALMKAARNGYSRIVSLLVLHGARIDILDHHDDNAAILAMRKQHLSIQKFLIKARKTQSKISMKNVWNRKGRMHVVNQTDNPVNGFISSLN